MILCCGEAVMDMIPSHIHDGAFVPQAGGAALNTARALARLGCEAGFVGGLSTDMFGRQLSSALHESGAETSLAVVSDRSTTLAFVSEGADGPEYEFLDEGSAGRCVTAGDLSGRTQGADAALFGGISLAADPCGEAFVSLAREPGPVVMVDPNIRPALVSDTDSYRARLRDIMTCADIVKLSVVDLDWLVPSVSDLRAQVHAALPPGVRLVFVTDGGEGAHAFLPGGEHVHVPAVPVQVINTVGAGDAFNAGVLAGLSERGLLCQDALQGIKADQLTPVMQFATRVAAAAVSSEGAAPPRREYIFPAG